MKQLSINLRKLLTDAQISENELARRTGVSQQIINRILSGTNTNPKIATLSPLANYFLISISQLIEGDLSSSPTRLNVIHRGWQNIPLIDLSMLAQSTLKDLILKQTNQILVDIDSPNELFAVTMSDSSMEPKFSEGTLLIFDANRKVGDGEFVLLHVSQQEVVIRQVFIRGDTYYKKCFNVNYSDYELNAIESCALYLGTLIQSRTNFSS